MPYSGSIDPGAGAVPHEDEDELWHKREVSRTASTKLECISTAKEVDRDVLRRVMDQIHLGNMGTRRLTNTIAGIPGLVTALLDEAYGQVMPWLEPAIAKDGRQAAEYATKALKRRWPEAEPAIAREILGDDPNRRAARFLCAYYVKAFVLKVEPSWEWESVADWAKDVLSKKASSSKTASAKLEKVKFVVNGMTGIRTLRALERCNLLSPRIHRTIMATPRAACLFIRNFVGKRTPEAEPVIATDAAAAYFYCKHYINTRWPEAEAALSTSPRFACLYAKFILKEPWPAGEPAIAQDEQWARDYVTDMLDLKESAVGKWIAQMRSKSKTASSSLSLLRLRLFRTLNALERHGMMSGAIGRAMASRPNWLGAILEERGTTTPEWFVNLCVNARVPEMFTHALRTRRRYPAMERYIAECVLGSDSDLARDGVYYFAVCVKGLLPRQAQEQFQVMRGEAGTWAQEVVVAKHPAAPVKTASSSLSRWRSTKVYQVLDHYKLVTTRLKNAFLASPLTAADFAIALGRRMPEFEQAIARDEKATYYYGIYVLRDPKFREWADRVSGRLRQETDEVLRQLQASTKTASSQFDLDILYRSRAVQTLERHGLLTKPILRAVASSAKPAFNYAKFTVKGVWPEGEAAIAKRADTAYFYSREVTHKRFPAGEPAILTGRGGFDAAHMTYSYILALRNEDPQSIDADLLDHVEEVVASNPEFAFRYAWMCLKSRWSGPHAERAEVSIKSDPAWWERYETLPSEPATKTASATLSGDVAGRWPTRRICRVLYRYGIGKRVTDAAEAANATNAILALGYSKFMGQRFPSLEQVIVKDYAQAISYAEVVVKGRWAELEQEMIQDPHSAPWISEYAARVIKGAWPEAEAKIAHDPDAVYDYAFKALHRQRFPAGEPAVAKVLLNPGDLFGRPQGYYSAWGYAQDIALQSKYDMAPASEREKAAEEWARSVVGQGVTAKTASVTLDVPFGRLITNGPLGALHRHFPSSRALAQAKRSALEGRDPGRAYHFAFGVLHDRWPEAEPLILMDNHTACQYAQTVIQGRWPELEEQIIRQDMRGAVAYCTLVLHGPWSEMQDRIVMSSGAFEYALYVLRMHDPIKIGQWIRQERQRIAGQGVTAAAKTASTKLVINSYRIHEVANALQQAGFWRGRIVNAFITSPRAAYAYAHDVIEGRWPEAEPYIAQSAEWGFAYANNVIKGRWSEAEPVIAAHPRAACYYAKEVIKGRWPEGELSILKDPEWATWYATSVVFGEWPEAEPMLARDPKWAYIYARQALELPEGAARTWGQDYLASHGAKMSSTKIASPKIKDCPDEVLHALYRHGLGGRVRAVAEQQAMQTLQGAFSYARDVIQGRWPAIEDEMSSSFLADAYARDVIQGRWPGGPLRDKAEATIVQDPQQAFNYAAGVLKGRWPDAEPVIGRNAMWAYNYAKYVLKGRWLEAEAVIAQSPEWAFRYAEGVLHDQWSGPLRDVAESAIARQAYYAREYAHLVLELPQDKIDTWGEEYLASRGVKVSSAKTASTTLPRNITTWYNYHNDVYQVLQRTGMWTSKLRAPFAEDPDRAILFAKFITRGRFPEGEAAIASDPNVAYEYCQDVIKGRFPGPHREEAESRLRQIQDFWSPYIWSQISYVEPDKVKFFGKVMPWQEAMRMIVPPQDQPQVQGTIKFIERHLDHLGGPTAVGDYMCKEVIPMIREDYMTIHGQEFPAAV